MSVLESLLRRELHAFDPLVLRTIAEPYGPDETVFGPWRPVQPADEGGVTFRRCEAHDVSWRGYGVPCFCCAAGIDPLKNY